MGTQGGGFYTHRSPLLGKAVDVLWRVRCPSFSSGGPVFSSLVIFGFDGY